MKPLSSVHILLVVFLLITLFSFLKLGQHPISPWDEARNGVNAIEMLRNQDWFNLHYAGQPDTWNTKPPLFIWCQALSFRLLGFNEFALRLPSAISILLAFFFIYKIIRLYKPIEFALYSCLILVSVKGLIGWHVGRTGDFDALLLFLLMAHVYYFLLFFEFKKNNALLLSAIFLGFAFLTKGPASFVLMPGLLIYIFIRKKFTLLIFKKVTWYSITIFMAFPLVWFFVQNNWGIDYSNIEKGDNAFERLFTTDLFIRFTEANPNFKTAFDFSFIFYSLDKSFNLWHFVFFGFLFFGLYKIIKNKKQAFNNLFNVPSSRLLLFSLCIYLPLVIFLAIAAKSNRWYLAPTLPFVGVITFHGIQYLWKKIKWMKYIFYLLLVFTMSRRFSEINTIKEKPSIFSKNEQLLKNASGIVQVGTIEQDILLYLYFHNRNLSFTNTPPNLSEGEIILIAKRNKSKDWKNDFEIIVDDGDYYILQ